MSVGKVALVIDNRVYVKVEESQKPYFIVEFREGGIIFPNKTIPEIKVLHISSQKFGLTEYTINMLVETMKARLNQYMQKRRGKRQTESRWNENWIALLPVLSSKLFPSRECELYLEIQKLFKEVVPQAPVVNRSAACLRDHRFSACESSVAASSSAEGNPVLESKSAALVIRREIYVQMDWKNGSNWDISTGGLIFNLREIPIQKQLSVQSLQSYGLSDNFIDSLVNLIKARSILMSKKEPSNWQDKYLRELVEEKYPTPVEWQRVWDKLRSEMIDKLFNKSNSEIHLQLKKLCGINDAPKIPVTLNPWGSKAKENENLLKQLREIVEHGLFELAIDSKTSVYIEHGHFTLVNTDEKNKNCPVLYLKEGFLEKNLINRLKVLIVQWKTNEKLVAYREQQSSSRFNWADSVEWEEWEEKFEELCEELGSAVGLDKPIDSKNEKILALSTPSPIIYVPGRRPSPLLNSGMDWPPLLSSSPM